MSDKIYDQRELDYLAYEEETVESFEIMEDKLNHTSDITSMDYARSRGVSDEYSSLSFFAEDSVNAPEEVFQYVDDDGNIVTFTEEERQMVQGYERGDTYPIDGLEGHHIETVRDNPDNLALAADQDNVVLATEQGHLMHLHDGNSHNPTHERYDGLFQNNEDRLEITLQHNQDEIMLSTFQEGMITAGGAAVIFTVLYASIQGYKLRKDPRPWTQKRLTYIKETVGIAVISGGLAGVGFLSKKGLEEALIPVGEMLQGSMMEHMADILVINGVFLTMTMTSAAIKYWRDRKNGLTAEEAGQRLKQTAVTGAAEGAVFVSLGFGVDALGSFATDTLIDALIPDPTGLVIVGRITYSASKFGKKWWDSDKHKQSIRKCTDVRIMYQEKRALEAIR
ncbi:hypothetical protein [Salisediminibacterium beveridgei]|uniref:Uncharacterized protein n=1 Tax=Salisediminibacterium beveridgei TaxID=632773 RepID=A0A1D7QZM7_9BACI|nr:hypothetical protein [Salisediminibacterium beveridgei]AOM84458.1 hypothetical protein BBEV_3142 [Salisediminibacterium beveridgei]